MCFIFRYVLIDITRHGSTGKSKQLSTLQTNSKNLHSQYPLAECNPNNLPPNHHLNPPSTTECPRTIRSNPLTHRDPSKTSSPKVRIPSPWLDWPIPYNSDGSFQTYGYAPSLVISASFTDPGIPAWTQNILSKMTALISILSNTLLTEANKSSSNSRSSDNFSNRFISLSS